MKRFEQLCRCGVVAVLLGGAFVLSVPANAQVPGAVGTPGQRQERPDQRSAPAIAAENYDPKGVQIGSFKLFPELELDEVYNDNIYAVPTADAKTGSFIQLVKPTLDLRSDWSVHMLNAYAKGGLGFYGVDGTFNNYYDVSLGTDGRVDIQRDWNVYGGASWNRRHEERGSPNTVTTSTLPVTVYNQIIANTGYYQKYNRFSARLDGRLDNYVYFNNGLGAANGVIPNSDRNRTELREALRLGYEFSPGYEVWVRGGTNQRNYVQTDVTGQNRSSYGYDIIGGVTVDLGGITSIEAFAGYLQQFYYDPQFANISVPTFGLTGFWNPMRELWIKPFVRRTVDDSALTTSAAYVNTVGGLDVNYHMRPNVRLNVHADYAVADYQPVAGTPGNRYDQYLTFRADVMYLLTPNFFVGPSYQYLTRWSNQPNSNYDQNLIMLRLGTRI